MPDSTTIETRKSDHIRINLEEDVQSGLTTGLENYRFIHEALPEINLGDIDLSQTLFGRKIDAPILISSMTGGTKRAAEINAVLARAAQSGKIGIGVGSQRAALEQPDLQESFKLRKFAPDVLIFANIGAVQLNYQYTSEECRRAVDMVEADALYLHLNSMQEALQPEGNTRFAGLAQKIGAVCRALAVPVIVKEVGWGISERSARLLIEAGVAGIDVAGAGGTSWSQVEMHRIQDESRARVAAAFRGWGIPTSESIRMVRGVSSKITIIASGGLRDGVDIAKCIALGASLGGMASPFLKAAAQSERPVETVAQVIEEIKAEIRICMFGVGAGDLSSLKLVQLKSLDGR